MAQSAYLPAVAIPDSAVLDVPRRSVLVRITHWINAASFIALVVSGIGILLSHPRFYWGETGGVEFARKRNGWWSIRLTLSGTAST